MTVVGNIWYMDYMQGGVRLADPPRSKIGALWSAAVLYWRSRNFDRIVTSEGNSRPAGLALLVLLLAASRSRKLVLVEFLPGRKSGALGTLVGAVYRRLLNRVSVAIQVMTPWEADVYAGEYRLDRSLLHVIPFFHWDDRTPAREWVPVDRRRGVMCSGRNSCDWETLFAAAAGQAWDLTVVCDPADRALVERLSSGQKVTILSNIPRAEHDRLFGASAVYVLALRDRGSSAGHVRLMSGIAVGTPVVASDIRGLDGYSQLAVALVPPEGPRELRSAVNDVLANQDGARRRVQDAASLAMEWPFSTYVGAVAKLVVDQTPAN